MGLSSEPFLQSEVPVITQTLGLRHHLAASTIARTRLGAFRSPGQCLAWETRDPRSPETGIAHPRLEKLEVSQGLPHLCEWQPQAPGQLPPRRASGGLPQACGGGWTTCWPRGSSGQGAGRSLHSLLGGVPDPSTTLDPNQRLDQAGNWLEGHRNLGGGGLGGAAQGAGPLQVCCTRSSSHPKRHSKGCGC